MEVELFQIGGDNFPSRSQRKKAASQETCGSRPRGVRCRAWSVFREKHSTNGADGSRPGLTLGPVSERVEIGQ